MREITRDVLKTMKTGTRIRLNKAKFDDEFIKVNFNHNFVVLRKAGHLKPIKFHLKFVLKHYKR